MDKICTEPNRSHHGSSRAAGCHVVDENLQWNSTDPSYILALACCQNQVRVHSFWLYDHCNNWLILLPCGNWNSPYQVSMWSWRWESYAEFPLASSFFSEFVHPWAWERQCLYFRRWISVRVDTQCRRGSSVSKSLSIFVHPEVLCKATGQFPLLFTDAESIWKVMTHHAWPGSSPLFVLSVVV